MHYAECHYVESHYAECYGALSITIKNCNAQRHIQNSIYHSITIVSILISVILQSVVKWNVAVLNVVAPLRILKFCLGSLEEKKKFGICFKTVLQWPQS